MWCIIVGIAHFQAQNPLQKVDFPQAATLFSTKLTKPPNTCNHPLPQSVIKAQQTVKLISRNPSVRNDIITPTCREYGKEGTPEREQFDTEAAAFCLAETLKAESQMPEKLYPQT